MGKNSTRKGLHMSNVIIFSKWFIKNSIYVKIKITGSLETTPSLDLWKWYIYPNDDLPNVG